MIRPIAKVIDDCGIKNKQVYQVLRIFAHESRQLAPRFTAVRAVQAECEPGKNVRYGLTYVTFGVP
ncbi:MAG: hypothetical protein LBF84_02525 [Holosporales bacterium]|nr:hypothetical protein [Holosporales bacterium]